jgi:predicted secreted hydrolase
MMRPLVWVAAVALCVPALVAAAGAPLPPDDATQAPAPFALALTPREFVFPRDHGPHPEFREEWWYLTGNLDGATGERFGFELTFFRVALAPAVSAPAASAWRTPQMYMAHFAVTDVPARHFAFAQKLERGALGLAGARGEPLEVWLDDWSLTAAADGSWRLCARQAGYQLELTLASTTPPMLNGTAGLSRKSDAPVDASYYYSLPRLRAHGRLLRDGRPLEVQGLAWFDREWGSGGLARVQAGWDWYALQLADGSALMFYALREHGGGRDPHSAGTFRDADGTTRALASDEVEIAVTDSWRNARGDRYPASWRITVPALTLALSVHPVLPDQELKTSPDYWEGAVDVAGTRAARALAGRGYVELVGYAERASASATGAAAQLGR